MTQWLTDRAPARSSSSGRPVDHQAAQTAGRRARLAHPMMRRITQLVLDLHRLTHRREAGPPLISEIPARTAMALCADGALLAIRPGEHAPIAPLAAYGLAAPAPIAVPAHIAPAAFAGCRSGRGQDALADHLARVLGIPDLTYAYDEETGYLLILGRIADAVPGDEGILAEALTAVLTTCRSLAEQARTDQALEAARLAVAEADRTKADFLALMGHELRTPLNAVIGFSELIATQVYGPLGHARYADYAGAVLQSGSELLAVIDTVLDFAQRSGDVGSPLDETVDLPVVVATACALVRMQAEAAEVVLRIDAPPALPRLRGDRRMLSQMVVHLLSNAVKFTPRHGCATATLGLAGDGGVVLAVEDTGIGMSPAEAEQAMHPFSQIGPFMTRRVKGTGLGLPLARRIAESHQGTLIIASSPGMGTRVTVTLPAGRLIGGLGSAAG